MSKYGQQRNIPTNLPRWALAADGVCTWLVPDLIGLRLRELGYCILGRPRTRLSQQSQVPKTHWVTLNEGVAEALNAWTAGPASEEMDVGEFVKAWMQR